MGGVCYKTGGRGRRGFTVFEMLCAVLVVGVIGLMVVPTVTGVTTSPGLKTAANMLAADIEYIESACISNPQSAVVLRVDVAANRYWVAAAGSVSTPITSPSDGQAYLNDFSTGRSSRLQGVSIQSVSGLGAGTAFTIGFDAYGRPTTSGTTVTITLTNNGSSMNVVIDGTTGEVTVQ